MLKIYLFNQFALSLNDQPLRPSLRPKTLELWGYLLLHQHEPVLRQSVAFALWPDTDDKTALTNCRRHIHHLKSLLTDISPDAHWLDTDHKSVSWNPDFPVWVDAIVFQQWAEHDSTLADAVALYTGELLQECYADWIFYERERYRERYIACLNRLVAVNMSARDYLQAVDYVQQLLAADPFRETAIRQLMRLMCYNDDRAGALAIYHEFVKQLRQELNVEPMEQTVDLYQTILSNRAQITGETDPHTSRVMADTLDADLPFAGRDDEIILLRNLWRRAAEGKGQVVFIGGMAGMGKSRLVDELGKLAQGQGAWVLTGGTSFMEPVPPQAFVEAITPALAALVTAADDQQSVAPLGLFIAELYQLHPELKSLALMAQPQTRQDVFATFSKCFIALTRSRPLLLVLEDMHWASAYTLELLDHLLRSALHRPLMVVITYRPEDTARSHPLRDLMRRFRQESFNTQMMLDAIDANAIRMILARLFGDSSGHEALTQTLLNVSDGSPLFIRELLRSYVETGVIQQMADGWRVRSAPAAPPPSQIQAIIGERLTRLSADTRSLVAIAAVIGVSFDLELLREVSGWADGLLFDGLHELLDRGIIRESSGQGVFDYTFSHYLIWQAIYETLDVPDRQRRHRRIAQVMHELYGETHAASLLLLANHYDMGGMGDTAARFYLITAQRDHALYANHEALMHITRALALTEDIRTRFDLLSLRERIEAREADRPAQLRTIEALEKLAGQDSDLLCSAVLCRVRYLHDIGDQTAEQAAIGRLEQIARGERWQAELSLAKSRYFMQLGDYDTAHRATAIALSQLTALGDDDGTMRCYAILTEIALHRGDFEAATAYIDQMKDRATDYSQIAIRLNHLKHAGTRAFMAQQYQVSLGFFEELRAEGEHYDDNQSQMVAHFYLAMTHARLANILLADTHYDRASHLVEKYGSTNIRQALRINRGTFKAATGQVRQASEEFRVALRMMSDAGDKRGIYTCTLNLSVLHLWQEDPAKARSYAEHALAVADELGSIAYRASALSSIGFADCAAGDYMSSIHYLEQAVALRVQIGEQQTSLLEDLVELAFAYLQADARDKAADLLGEILARLSEADHSAYNFQRVLWYASQLCRDVGNRQQADKLLHEAHNLLQHQLDQLPLKQRDAYCRLPFNRAILTAVQG